jgi:hypothetical protein
MHVFGEETRRKEITWKRWGSWESIMTMDIKGNQMA